MRDIVATIQPEQDVIVRADVTETICVQGKSLQTSGMQLKRPPRRPRYIPYISLTKYQFRAARTTSGGTTCLWFPTSATDNGGRYTSLVPARLPPAELGLRALQVLGVRYWVSGPNRPFPNTQYLTPNT